MSTDFILTLDRLQAAVAGAAAIRLRQALEPAGGPGSKVFPPTHEGGQYAWETRRVDGQDVRCVLLDSVQSQANRCELALLDALRDGRLRLPLIEARFAEFSDLGAVSTLEAPHRIADAIFRDSTLDGVPFRDSVIGQAFIESTIRDANGLFRWCPTALVFGMWDSTGSVGGLGTKFARALSAEIIGYGVQAGVHTSSRIDPLGIKNIEIYVTPDEDWTTDAGAAKQGKSGPEKTKPSALNHSNIPPTLSVADDNYTSVKKASRSGAASASIAPNSAPCCRCRACASCASRRPTARPMPRATTPPAPCSRRWRWRRWRCSASRAVSICVRAAC